MVDYLSRSRDEKKNEKRNDCDCQCQNPCRFPFFPFPISRGTNCQSLVAIANTVLALPANTPVTITTATSTFTGIFIGFNLANGTVVFTDGVQTRTFTLSQICTIS